MIRPNSKKETPLWDLFEEQPLRLHHPALADLKCGSGIPVAAVSPVRGGIVWWNANYMIDEKLTGFGGSGFGENPVGGAILYDPPTDTWIVKRRGDKAIYRFERADRELADWWANNKQYFPSLEELHQIARRD